jgi:hypothetical protein
MSCLRTFTIIIFLLSLVLLAKGSTLVGPTQKFDEFGDLNCEDEMAHLDNFALQLQQEPNAKGVIIFYGGKTFRGKLPRRGDAAARAARLRAYLVQRRGIPTNQVVVIDGGYAEAWHVGIWVVQSGESMPTPDPSIPVEQIKFRKGRVNPRAYRCGI